MKYLWISLIPSALLTAIVLSPIGSGIGIVLLLSIIGAPLYFAMTALPTVLFVYACFVVAYTLLRILRVRWVLALMIAGALAPGARYAAPALWNAYTAKLAEGHLAGQSALVIPPAAGEVVGIEDGLAKCEAACQELLMRRPGTVVVTGRFVGASGTPKAAVPAKAKAWVLREADNQTCPYVDITVRGDDLRPFYELLNLDGLCIHKADMPQQVDILFQSDSSLPFPLRPVQPIYRARDVIRQSQVWTRQGDAMIPIHFAFEGVLPVVKSPLVLFTDQSRGMEIRFSAAPQMDMTPVATTVPLRSASDLISAVFRDMNALPTRSESLAALEQRRAERDAKKRRDIETIKAETEAEIQVVVKALAAGDLDHANKVARKLLDSDGMALLGPSRALDLVLAGLDTKGAEVTEWPSSRLMPFINDLPPEERLRAVRHGLAALMAEPDTLMDRSEGWKYRQVVESLIRNFDREEFQSFEADIEALMTTRNGRLYGKRLISALGAFGPEKTQILLAWGKQIATDGDLDERNLAIELSAGLCLMGPDADRGVFLGAVDPIKDHFDLRSDVIARALAVGLDDADIAALVVFGEGKNSNEVGALADIADARARWANIAPDAGLRGMDRAAQMLLWCLDDVYWPQTPLRSRHLYAAF